MTDSQEILAEETEESSGRSVLRVMLITAVSLLLFYGIVAIVMLPSIIYPFDQTPLSHSRAVDVTLENGDEDIPVSIFPAGDNAEVIFYLQGNIASRQYFLEEIMAHNQVGYTVVTMQWPGSEGRGGAISEERLKREALMVMNAMPSLTGQKDPIVHIQGYSMGSGIAVYVAANSKPVSLILQATYSSLCEIMTKRSFLPACYLPGVDTWDNRPLVVDIKAPVLLLHGEMDTLIPPQYGAKMASALKDAGNTPTVIIYPDIGHNNFWKSGHLMDIHAFLYRVMR